MRALFTLLLMLLPVLAGGQVWSPIALGTNETIRMVENTSFSARWVVGTGGFAAQSDHLREVWTTVDVGTSADLLSVIQPVSGQVWLGAGDGVVRRLVSGDWEGRNLPVADEDFSLFTRGSGTAAAVGTGGSIYVSLNGGDDWSLKYSAGVPLHGGKGFVTNRFWVVGDEGTILTTADGGDNFVLCDSGTSADLYAFLEGPAHIAVGEHGTILKSTDVGVTWEPRESGTSQTLRAIGSSGQNANWMLVAGDAGTVLKSTDGGDTWCRLTPDTVVDLHAVCMVTNSEYIVGGEGGLLLRTTTGGGECIAVAADLLPPAGLALDVYPNPLPAAGRVEFAAAQGGEYSIDLFDVAGRRLARLGEGRLAAGERRGIALDPQGLSAGVYFVRIRQGEAVLARRFTVLR
jgi:photosystem II stability/assembly factor-like uncharacterized protein